MSVPSVLMLSQEVHPIPPLKGAAVEQWIDTVAHRLSGFVPHVVSVPHPRLPDTEVVGGVRYQRIRMGALYNRLFRKITRLDPYSYVDRIVAYAESVRPDIVHVHNAPQFVPALRAGLPGARLLLHMHNEKPVRSLPALDALCGCSRYISDWFRAQGVQARRFAQLPNGVDVEAFRPAAPPARAAARSRFEVPQDRFAVLYVGRISPEKGPDLLVEAMRRLDPARFHLVLAGEWPRGDPRRSARVVFAESLRARLAGMPVSVLGHFAPEAMPEIYRAGDLLVVPSRFEEPFSMVAIEAMASGLPVLALAKGGMKEYMVDGENARVLPADADAAALAAGIESAAAAPPERLADLARAARSLVESRFTWAHVARSTERLYREILQ
jgi:UDP-N-acetylglucosamine:(glucosyl)LPS alpha-1,2-N-acetylglucosaminyltransferase